MPISAIIAKEHVAELAARRAWLNLGGNPISCAAALVTLDLVEQGYMQNAVEQGEYIMEALEEMRSHHPTLKHGRVAGKGLMIGAELVLDEKRTRRRSCATPSRRPRWKTGCSSSARARIRSASLHGS